MKPFETLTNAGQLHRLRRLAENALTAYDVREPRLTPLLHEDNTTFRVESANRERHVLRIHRLLRTVEAVRSEMSWLAALRRETEFIVPQPIPTRDGDLLTVASLEGIPEPRICVLFRWIDGRFLDSGLTPFHLERVGAFMAGLQLHGMRFQRPDNFMRGRVDNLTDQARRTSARGASETMVRGQVDHPEDETAAVRLIAEICSPDDGARVATLIRKVREAQQAVGQGPETFGLIHGDLHQGNYLFHQGQVRAIDFDDCGYGYYLYDMAVTLSEVNWRKNTPALRRSFLAGYRSVRSLSPEQEGYLDTFIALRDLQLITWKIEMRDHPAFREGWASSVKEMLQDIKDFIER
jgi:Ser/Thr protein kinase RdoA (MazF antagonist)